MAYADDIALFVKIPADIPALRAAIRTCVRATGASLIIRKSRALATGSWDRAINMMGISYCPDITVLGISFTSSIAQSGSTSWTRVTGQLRALARDVYSRDLCLTHCFQCSRLFTRQNVAYSTGVPSLEGACASTGIGHIMVHLERCDP
jgi:hypothetical protein